MFFLMIRRPPKTKRTDTLFPYTTLFRSRARFTRATCPSTVSTTSHAIPAAMTGPCHDPVRNPGMPGKKAKEKKASVRAIRSEEHTSELQSLMRISYTVFCLKKKKNNNAHHTTYK